MSAASVLPKGPIALATLRTSAVLFMRLPVQAGTLLLLAHLLGPSNFGAFTAIFALAVLHGVMATFGTHLALLRDLSQNQSKRAEVLPLALGATALCSAMLLALYLALCFSLLKIDTVDTPVIVCIGVSEIVFQPFLLVAAMERHALGQIARSQLVLALPQLLRFAACAMIWWADPAMPLKAYAIGHLTAVAIVLVTTLRSLPQPWPLPRFWRVPNSREWRENSGYAVLSLTGTGPGELDKVLAGHLLPLGLTGIYAAASRVVGALVIPVVAAVLSSLPRLFREAGSFDATLQRWLFAATATYGMLAGLVIWFSAPIIDWLFGPEYAGVGETAKWLAFAIPGMSLRFATMNVLTTVNLPWARIAIELFGLTLLVALGWWWSEAYSHWGFVLAVSVSEWTIAVLGWGAVLLHRHALNRHARQEDPSA